MIRSATTPARYLPAGSEAPRRFPATVAAAGILACLVAAPLMIASGFARPIDALLAFAMILFAILVAQSRPTALPVVVFAYLLSNRLLRRVVDYLAQEYTETPPTSLVVPALGILMGAAVLPHWRSLPASLRRGTHFYFAALAFGALVGVRWGGGMAFELVQWTAPFGFGLYVAWLRPTRAQFHRWVAAFAFLGVAALAYGWVQWLLLPPWDEFWVRNCGMHSIGNPAPMRCRFFGPFAAPGAAAMTGSLMAALLVMVPCVPAGLRWPMAVFLAVSGLATGVRSAALGGVAAAAAWICLRRGGGARTLVPLGLAFAVGALALPSLPGSEFAMRRLNSLGDISNDGSFRGRVAFSAWAVRQSLERPLGFGLGSSGLGATRLGGGALAAFDSGYVQPLYALGIPGALLLAAALGKLVAPLFTDRFWRGVQTPGLSEIARSIVIGGMVLMLVANLLRHEFACLFWMFVLPAHTAPRLRHGGFASFGTPLTGESGDPPEAVAIPRHGRTPIADPPNEFSAPVPRTENVP